MLIFIYIPVIGAICMDFGCASGLYMCRCVIAEMFTGGASLFDLSTLLEYRNGENPPNLPESIKKIEVKSIRVMILIVCMLLCLHTHMHTYAYTYTYAYTPTHAVIYVHIIICVFSSAVW